MNLHNSLATNLMYKLRMLHIIPAHATQKVLLQQTSNRVYCAQNVRDAKG